MYMQMRKINPLGWKKDILPLVQYGLEFNRRSEAGAYCSNKLAFDSLTMVLNVTVDLSFLFLMFHSSIEPT